jgi:DNA polymerase sigma
VNGLSSSHSDVDLCLTTPWDDPINGVSNMLILAECLRRHGMTEIYTVTKAKVPICKFWDPEYGLSCDVNVNNKIAIRNTQLIKAYVDVDPRVRPILMVVKYWAKQRALNDGR